jgi:hypothetical protein
METTRATTRRHLPTSPFKQPTAEPIKVFEVGQRVCHDKEGLGRVKTVDGTSAVVVDFGGGRLVRIATPFAKLDVL